MNDCIKLGELVVDICLFEFGMFLVCEFEFARQNHTSDIFNHVRDIFLFSCSVEFDDVILKRLERLCPS